MPTFLHVGCGRAGKSDTTPGFQSDDWTELRYDLDPNAAPDIVGNLIDMSGVASASMDAVFCRHNIEHLYAHEVAQALAEFCRVLKPEGFLVVACPDIQAVAELVANDRLLEPLYESGAAGWISPFDLLYGLRSDIEEGKTFMAHRSGFTARALVDSLRATGFQGIAVQRRAHPSYDLWALATPAAANQAEVMALVKKYLHQ